MDFSNLFLCLVCFSLCKLASQIEHNTRRSRRKPDFIQETSTQRKTGKSRNDKTDSHGTSVTKQIEDMFKNHAYELSILPKNHDKPTKVKLALLIESITGISEKNMDLTFTLQLHETWVDSRLKFKSRDINDSIVLPSRLISKLWVPDLYIVGSKSSTVHRTAVENIILRLFSDGKIYYSIKITTTVACLMNLKTFPLDTENCFLKFQSLGYNIDELLLEWDVGKHMDDLFMDPRLVTNMPEFSLVHHKFQAFNVTTTDMTWINGKKSRLQVSFEMKRYLLSVFFQSYFPALIMVVLAGMGMWIDPRSVPARVAMGVTSVLTISTIITGLKATLPKVSYLTAMDIYLWVCFLFVFCTVLEYCVLNYFMTKKTTKESLNSSPESKLIESHKNKLLKFLGQESEHNIRFQHFELSDDIAIVVRKCEVQQTNNLASKPSDLSNSGHPQLRKKVWVRVVSCDEYMGVINEARLGLCWVGEEITKIFKKTKSTKSWIDRWRKYINITINPSHLDRVASLLYFSTFIVFNIFYWVYYIITTQHESEDE